MFAIVHLRLPCKYKMQVKQPDSIWSDSIYCSWHGSNNKPIFQEMHAYTVLYVYSVYSSYIGSMALNKFYYCYC